MSKKDVWGFMGFCTFMALFIICLVSCSGGTAKETAVVGVTGDDVLEQIYNSGNYRILKDKETGCEYIAYGSGGITPRLQIDGSPRCIRN